MVADSETKPIRWSDEMNVAEKNVTEPKYLYPFPKKLTVEERTAKNIERDKDKYVTPQPDIPNGTRTRKLAKNPRNQPCICGSGKKFKKCCMNTVTTKSMYNVT